MSNTISICVCFSLLILTSTAIVAKQHDSGNLAGVFSSCGHDEFNVEVNDLLPTYKDIEALPKCLQQPVQRELILKHRTDFMNLYKYRDEDTYTPDEYRPTQKQQQIARAPTVSRGQIYANLPSAFSRKGINDLYEKYYSYNPIRYCHELWYDLDEDAQGNKLKIPFDPSGKWHTFLISVPRDCYWGNGGGEVRSESRVSDSVGNLLSPFWIVQFNSTGIARAIYHDEAEFIRIIRPVGAKGDRYPALVYGGKSLNIVPWFKKHLEQEVGHSLPIAAALFFSYFDAKKQRFVEGGANYARL